ncbi:hypothetical protein SOVF_144350 [Spinacia oleracea]|nr:hypothetical protein SOVF_144350 [Spinacia oleracea]
MQCYPSPPTQGCAAQYPNCPPPFMPPSHGYGGGFYSGGDVNHSGMQTNGDLKVGNNKVKSGGVDIDTIGGNHANQDGQQNSQDVTIGNIGC